MKTKVLNDRIDEFFKSKGFRKVESPGFVFVKSNGIRTIPFSLEELDEELSQIYESEILEVDKSIPSLDVINNYLKNISFNKGILRNTVHGNLYIFKLLILFFSKDPFYGSYKEELINQIGNSIQQETDNSEIEYSKKELQHIKAIIEQLENEKAISNKTSYEK